MTKEFQLVGPPGTGKTTTLTGEREEEYDPWGRNITRATERYGGARVYASSFTKTAAVELVRRDLPIPRQNVGTTHAFGYHLLGGMPILETKKGIEAWNAWCRENSDARGLHLSTEGGNEKDEPAWGGRSKEATKGDMLHEALNLYRAQMTPEGLWRPSVRDFARCLANFKKEAGYIDFTDMIEIPLRERLMLPGKPAMAFFDEVQDYSALMQALVRMWGEEMEGFVMAGDPDQCLYDGLNGADPGVFLNHPVDAENRRVLKQSWRVPQAVHAWAERWISRSQNRLEREYLPTDLEGCVRPSSATWRYPEPVVRDILQQLDRPNRKGDPRTVMVLTTCGYMLGPLKTALRERGIPFHNPYRKDDRQGWNPLKVGGEDRESTRITAVERILAYLRPDAATFGERSRFWTGDDVRCWAEFLQADGVIRKGMKAKLKDLSPAEVTVDDLMTVFEEEAVFSLVDVNLRWFQQHLMPSKRESLVYPIRVAEVRGGQALREQPRVIIGTGHSVKGGEADVVYVFPDMSPAGAEEWMGGPVSRDSVRRLFYVMATRAAEELVLCSPAAAAQAVPWR